MAAPTINSVTAPATATAGVPFTVGIIASDPAARPVNLVASVSNIAGETASQTVVVEVGSGPLTYTLTTDDPNTIITAGTTAGGFDVTAH
jgi:hypothetical protein